MELNILGPGFSVEISGIDLSAGLTDLRFTEIKGRLKIRPLFSRPELG
jgi:hypothetical protein